MLQNSTLKFLKELNRNNNKTWFDAHRSAYEAAKADMEIFIQRAIDRMSKRDPDLKEIKARSCMFRINRDIRFSKDKSPYKNNFGASINRGGKKSIYAGYYFHCQPGESFVGGGLWMPMAPETKKLRQEIDYCWKEFSKIIGSAKFKKVYGDLYDGADAALATMPKGYDKSNPAAKYLKLKSWIALSPLKDKELHAEDLLDKTIGAFEALYPLISFINGALAPDA